MLAWKIILTVLHCFALTTALIRILQRWRTRLLWWDDYLVVIPCALDFAGIVIFWLQPTDFPPPLESPGLRTFIFSPWTFTFICLSVIWLSRICLSLSLARIYLPGHPFRRLALFLCLLLVLLYLASVLVTTFRCPGARGTWYIPDLQTCDNSSFLNNIPATLFSIDFSSDIMLVAIPLGTLWRIKLPKIERLLVLSLFSSSALTLVVTIAYFSLYKAMIRRGTPTFTSDLLVMSRLQASSSLLACNLLVVTMLAYKLIRRWRSPGVPQPQPPTQLIGGSITPPDDHQTVSERPIVVPLSFTIISDRDFEPPHLAHNDYRRPLSISSLPVGPNSLRTKNEMFTSSPFP